MEDSRFALLTRAMASGEGVTVDDFLIETKHLMRESIDENPPAAAAPSLDQSAMDLSRRFASLGV